MGWVSGSVVLGRGKKKAKRRGGRDPGGMCPTHEQLSEGVRKGKKGTRLARGRKRTGKEEAHARSRKKEMSLEC